jgi:hypothetical protein
MILLYKTNGDRDGHWNKNVKKESYRMTQNKMVWPGTGRH